MLLALASCERNEGPHPGDQPPDRTPNGLITAEKKPGSPKDDKTAGDAPGEAAPEKDADGVLIEKKPPVAEPAPGHPGKVISPFNGQLIDVSGMEPGSLVADPTYPPEAKKHFRVPDPNAEAAKPPGLLDPSILIRPKGPPKDSGPATDSTDEP